MKRTDARNGVHRLLVHALLAGGALLFSFPFIWMLCTSVKVRSELAPERLSLLPTWPDTPSMTPYIATDEYPEPSAPEGVSAPLWKQSRPLIESSLREKLVAWTPQAWEMAENAPPAQLNAGSYEHAMINGLFAVLRERYTDAVRSAASSAPLVAESERFADERVLRQVFDSVYRRLELGGIRVRTTDRQFYTFATTGNWRVVEGAAELVTRQSNGALACEARIDYSNNLSTCFEFAPDHTSVQLDPASIDRIYVSYTSDDSWAKLEFQVVRDGVLYRADSAAHLVQHTPIEQELSWDTHRDPMRRRLDLVLSPYASAPATSPDFTIRLVVTPVSPVRAAFAKAMRNYSSAFREVNFLRYICTSFSLGILNVVLTIFSCTLAAYAFARLKWPGRDFLFGLMLATMMLPAQVTMIPTFLIYKSLGWYNSLLPLWVGSAFGSAFFIFLVRQFMKGIPRDLEDAGRIDGCGFLGIYWHVILPLVRPAIATIAIYTFIGAWNNFLGPLIYVNDERLFPLALGMFKFNLSLTQAGAFDIGILMAGSVLMCLPIIVLFLFMQRYFVQGVTLTGIKG